MLIVHTIAEVRENVARARKEGKLVGFVPTMGFLHEGHLSLVEESRKHAGYQVMSIFVNRIQFNDPKDFETYPVDLKRDFDMAEAAGVDAVFLPDDAEMYRAQRTFVDVELLTNHLCGAHRPGHFRGVYTVVCKLFNIVQPDVSVFGQKDIQQAITIERMVADLNIPVRIIIAPIVREPDGLAMSSRNKHLGADARERAVVISRSLRRAEELIAQGVRSAGDITASMREIIESGGPSAIDYISMVRYDDLQPVDRLEDPSVIAVATFFGSTRLIDNMIINKTNGGYACIW